VLDLCDPQLSARVQEVIGELSGGELKQLFSGQPWALKGRYLIYLLQLN
jgi:hypothetical protein